MSGKPPQCAKCPLVLCYPNIAADETPSFDKAPGFCPSILKEDIVRKSVQEYQRDDLREFARLASVQERECYEKTPDGLRTKIPRIEETIQLAHKNGFKRLGLAFCVGVMNEARMITGILETKGFDVVSVCCKVGATPKEVLGIGEEEKISGPGRYESMCSPITQAEVLNSEEVDFAILMGLCVGHDTLFIKYCKAPMTVLAVKDRVTGHNPLAAVYLSQSYYSRLLLPGSA
jgi:uncharacterized metal-binding protein